MHIQLYTALVWTLHPRSEVEVRDRCELLPTMVRENKARQYDFKGSYGSYFQTP